MTDARPPIAVVAIGRNEGERLQRCLRSVIKVSDLVVYVDSGSSDGSVAFARQLGAHVVALDMSKPFTAARARNEGFRQALDLRPDLRHIQFVDGDCEVQPDWLSLAGHFLDKRTNVAAVCGRRRERNPQASIYNQLCDDEWNTPTGEAKSCGGDVLIRVESLLAVGGYNDQVIAGEEPEMCVRLRAAGWLIWRLDAEMTLHDAAMFRVTQWWARTTRCGYAYALGAYLHGAPPERHWVREVRRTMLWGAGLPVVSLMGLLSSWPWLAIVVLLAYPAQVLRLWRRAPQPSAWALTRAVFDTVCKFPEMVGVWRFWRDRIARRTPTIIEYK